MTDSETPAASRTLWWRWGGAALVVLGLVWWIFGGTEAAPPSDDVVAEAGRGPDVAGSAVLPSARVQGRVYVERPRPAPEPVVEVVLDSAGGVTARWASTGGDDGGDTDEPTAEADATGGVAADPEGADPVDGRAEPSSASDAGVAEDDGAELGVEPDDIEPEPVDLEPPPGECTVIAWSDGTQVSAVTPCEADGTFEVELNPGHHGRTAFEILVPGFLRAVVEVDVPDGGVGRLPPVALGAAQTIAGQVVNADGEPLEGIVVRARPRPDLDEPEPWRATTDAEGSFVMDTLPAGPVTLRAEAPGFAPSVVEAIAPQSDLLITLQGLVDIRGRVVGPAQVLSRARVRIEGSGVWPARQHQAEPSGDFVLPQIPDGIYALEAVVEAEQPGEPELASIPLENVTPDLSVTLALVPAFRVPVTVLDPQGDSVAGARVVLSNSSVGLLPRVATTDDAGVVSIGPVVVGPYVLRAEADGFLPAPAVTVVVDGTPTPPQIFTLAKPGRIEGEVVDDDGHPVPNARVELSAEHLFSAGEGQARAAVAQAMLRAAGSLGVTEGPVPSVPHDTEALTSATDSAAQADRDGRFSFEMLTPGTYRLEASHGRFARSEVVTVALKAARTKAGVRLVLRRGHALTGRVRDGNDRPVRGAMVRLDDGTAAFTDRRGLFDAGLRRGRQRLRVSADGLAPTALEVRIVDEPVDVEISLGRARAGLSGRVEGGNGEVLADARVTLRSIDGLSPTQLAWTDERGIYRFEDLPPGEIEVEVDHPEHGPTRRRITLEREDAEARVDLQLISGWALEVEVLAEGTREPIAGASVVAAGHHARTDAEGRATLRHLIDDRVRVEVSAVDFGSRTRSVDHDDAERQSIRVELSQGGGVQGRVIDYRGDPVAGVAVRILDAEGAVLARAVTDGRGGFSALGLPAGDIEVTADPPSERDEELAVAAQSTDVLRGHVTKGVVLRFDRR